MPISDSNHFGRSELLIRSRFPVALILRREGKRYENGATNGWWRIIFQNTICIGDVDWSFRFVCVSVWSLAACVWQMKRSSESGLAGHLAPHGGAFLIHH